MKLGAALGAAALVMSAACTQDLAVSNPNNPDVARALASAADVQSLAISSVNAWYKASTYYDPWTATSVTVDNMTANFGNFGMRFQNVEPRIPYDNTASGADHEMSQEPWNRQYKALGAANDVLVAVAAGVVLPGGDQYVDLARFAQAGSLMQLALLFDKAFLVDETFDATKGAPQLTPYPDMGKAVQAKFDALIAATAGKTFTYADASTIFPMVGVNFSAVTLNRMANTMNAMLLAYMPRNAAEAAKVDWAKVLQYADKGIGTGSAGTPFDVTILADKSAWFSNIQYYFDDPTWMRVDQHLVHQMDAAVPDKFTGTLVPPSGNGDARLGTDYKYEGNVIGDATRGIVMQSPYSQSRYFAISQNSPTNRVGPTPYILAAENDLIKAEALVRTGGDLTLATSLINKTRVTRGKLTPAAPSDGTAKLLAEITYEREVELTGTTGFNLFYVRHDDAAQAGTLHQLPVPGAELETDGLPYYTFGGVGSPVENLLPIGRSSFAAALQAGVVKQLALPNGAVMNLHLGARPEGLPSIFRR
jgi:hypothetical protein